MGAKAEKEQTNAETANVSSLAWISRIAGHIKDGHRVRCRDCIDIMVPVKALL